VVWADPWDVLVIPPGPGAGVYVPADDNDAVLRFDLLNGAYLGDFAAINSFPQQISETAQGTFLVAVFSGSDGDVVELAQDGTPVAMYAVFEVTGARGVAELGNGNILVSGSWRVRVRSNRCSRRNGDHGSQWAVCLSSRNP